MSNSILETLNPNFKASAKKIKGNLYEFNENYKSFKQIKDPDVFSKKWEDWHNHSCQTQKDIEVLKQRFLYLYGFKEEKGLAKYLSDKKLILDAGCGLGIKASWIASLAPNSKVIAVDISNSVYIAAEKYKDLKNLVFIKGDIAKQYFLDNTFDLVICDQVLHHTISPKETLKNLVTMLKCGRDIFTYVYAKKALPRELIDEFFRQNAQKFNDKELLELSEQLTILGKALSELNVKVNVPDIPILGIKGGVWDIQRFIYYNFIKCFWNEELGFEFSKLTNYDWYAPSIAYRYSEEEFKSMLKENGLKIIKFIQDEMASYSGIFRKTCPEVSKQ